MINPELLFIQNEDVSLLLVRWFLIQEWSRGIQPKLGRSASSRRYRKECRNRPAGIIEVEIGAVMNGESILFVDNKYPYDAISGVRDGSLSHMVLWSKNRPLSQEEIIAELGTRLGLDAAYLVVVNDKRIQSAPGMWHAQVFVKNG